MASIARLPRAATSDRVYTDAEFEFLRAVDAFKRERGTRFPTLSELFRVLLSLGYRKVDGPAPPDRPAAKEPATAGKVRGVYRWKDQDERDSLEARAVELRAGGMTYEQIADELGVSPATAFRMVKGN